MNRNKGRFIAGAVCPACGQLDTLQLLYQDQTKQVWCTSCDYSESIRDNSPANIAANERTKEQQTVAATPAKSSLGNIVHWSSLDDK